MGSFMSKWPSHMLEADSNPEDIFPIAWDMDQNLDMVLPWYRPAEKSEKRAEELRLEGNFYHKYKHFDQALMLYNISIMHSPHPVLNNEDLSVCTQQDKGDMYSFPLINPARYGGTVDCESKSLGKAFADRSTLLFDLGFYKKSLEDIALAEEYGVPQDIMLALELKKDKCLRGITKGKNPPPSTKMLDEYKQKWEKNYETFLWRVMKINNQDEGFKAPSLEERLAVQAKQSPKLKNPNRTIPAFSNAVKISRTPSGRRGVFAAKYIRPGDVVGVERAYLVHIQWDKLATFCSTCARYCLIPLPCPGCSKAIFCSKLCRTKGLAEDHWYDCKILPSLIVLGYGHLSSSYNMFKTCNFKQMKKMNRDLQKQKTDTPEKLGFNSKGVYSSTSYEPIYHLCMHWKDTSDNWKKSLLAFFIARFLQLSGRFFVNKAGEPVPVTKEDIIETAKALFINFRKKRSNTFGICGLGNHENDLEDAFGLFPAFSLNNHSCYPSALIVNFGRSSAMVATRPIKVGEEITLSYVSPFDISEIAERRQRLKKYSFECECEACTGKWPTFAVLTKRPGQYKCVNCAARTADKITVCDRCNKANKRTQISIIDKLHKVSRTGKDIKRLGVKLYDKEPFNKEDIRALMNAAEMIHEYHVMPCVSYVVLRICIEKCALEGWLWNSKE